MIEHLSKAKDLIDKVVRFFQDNGFQFHEMTEVSQGGQKYLRITVSIKIS